MKSSAAGVKVFWISNIYPAWDIASANHTYVALNYEMVMCNYSDGSPDPTPHASCPSGEKKNLDATLSNLLSQEQTQYTTAKQKGLTFVFAPLGTLLADNYSYQDYAFLKNTDIVFYQTESLQDNPNALGTNDPAQFVPAYAQKVKDVLGKMRSYVSSGKIWVQVSLNPPKNRCMSAEQAEKYIDSITDRSGENADVIMIFYSQSSLWDSTCAASGFPKRAQILESVISHYRQ